MNVAIDVFQRVCNGRYAGGHHVARASAEDRVGGGGIVVYGGSCSADNVFFVRAFGAHVNEHLCHTRNFLAAGGA